MQLRDDYFAAYRSLKLTRDAGGVLVVEFHTKGGPFRFTAIRSLSMPFTGSLKIERTRLTPRSLSDPLGSIQAGSKPEQRIDQR